MTEESADGADAGQARAPGPEVAAGQLHHGEPDSGTTTGETEQLGGSAAGVRER